MAGRTAAQIDLVLIDKVELSHDTRRFRFALPSSSHVLGLPTGQHISLSYIEDGKVQSRYVRRPRVAASSPRRGRADIIAVTTAARCPARSSYTPTSSDRDVGIVDFVIKVYYKNVHPKFPEGGKVSQYVDSLKFGETIKAQGPKGRLTYRVRGRRPPRPADRGPPARAPDARARAPGAAGRGRLRHPPEEVAGRRRRQQVREARRHARRRHGHHADAPDQR